MGKVFIFLWRCWMGVLGFVLTMVFFLPVYVLSFHKKHYKYAYKFIRLWAMGMFYGMGFRYTLHQLSNEVIDKDTQYVIIANHTSVMDIMLPCILFPHHPICFVGKKELVKIPVFGTIYKRICVMVDRNSARSRADVYRRCAERMQEGDSIVIFPEGGVSEDENVVLQDFKDGAFILSTKHHVPMAVFTFIGLKEMFPFDNFKGHPGRVDVYFNGILSPEIPLLEMKQRAFSEIKNTLQNKQL